MRNVTIEYRDDGFVVVLDGQNVSAPLVEFRSVKVIADAFPSWKQRTPLFNRPVSKADRDLRRRMGRARHTHA